MSNDVLRKLQYKDAGQEVLVMNAPQAYQGVLADFLGDVHTDIIKDTYPFVQVFGTSNEEIQALARKGAKVLEEDGLFWLCYPKKSSKTYKGSDCSRESVAGLLAQEGFEPVRQIALDEDWSALRFRHVRHIKSMSRKWAVTKEGKQRTES